MTVQTKNLLVIDGVTYTLSKSDTDKITKLLGIGVTEEVSTPVETPKTKTKSTRIVGSLEQDGMYVRTIKDKFISSKARYAIKMSATDNGATKLGKGNAVYDKLAKDDKYVQVYKFSSVDDAKKFMDAQESKMNK